MKRSCCLLAVLSMVGLAMFVAAGVPSLAAEKELVNSMGMKFVSIPSGEFMMGSRETPESVANNPAYSDKPGKVEWFQREHPLHKVTITRAFYLQTTEATVDQFRAFAADSGYKTDAEREGWGWVHDFDQDKWVK